MFNSVCEQCAISGTLVSKLHTVSKETHRMHNCTKVELPSSHAISYNYTHIKFALCQMTLIREIYMLETVPKTRLEKWSHFI